MGVAEPVSSLHESQFTWFMVPSNCSSWQVRMTSGVVKIDNNEAKNEMMFAGIKSQAWMTRCCGVVMGSMSQDGSRP